MGRTVLDLIAARTLAPYDDVPLPLGLLFDVEGDLVCLYVGGLQPEEVLRDAKRITSRSDETSTLALTGGHWSGEAPTRLLDDVPAKLRTLGLNALANHLEVRR